MRSLHDAAYLSRRASEEARKADKAAAEGADPAVVAIRRELALLYKMRAMSQPFFTQRPEKIAQADTILKADDAPAKAFHG